MNATPDAISALDIDCIEESPFNPRKTFTDIDELVSSIRAEGRIHSPLLVRPITRNHLRDDIVSGFEVVFGHRRLRAAQVLGLATVPCMVRAMTDAQARSAQVAENLARTDVHPIEEAEGYRAMVDHDGVTPDQLALSTGKSLSYIYGRLKLLEACPEIRTACLANEVGTEVALLIARLRTPKLQQKALAAIRNDTSQHARLDDGGKKSFRHIRDLLAEKFTLHLADAIFDREDAALVPDVGACAGCPKRTGNAPEFHDLANPTRDGAHRYTTRHGGPDICTDPDCFAAKKDAHLQRQAQKLAAEGAAVVTGNKARAAISAQGEVKGDFMALEDVRKMLKGKAKEATKLPMVNIQDPRSGKVKKAVKRADLVSAGLLSPDAAKKANPGARLEEQHRRAEQQRQRQADAAAQRARQHMRLLLHVRELAQGRERDAFELRMVAAAALAGVQYQDRAMLCQLHGVDNVDALKHQVDTLDAQALTQLLLDCILVDNVWPQWHDASSQPGPLLALAQHYGVDAQAVMSAATEPASTPSTAGAGAKKAEPAAKPERAKSKAPMTPPPGVKYHDAATGQRWSGRGLQPAWMKAALRGGKTLDDLLVKGAVDQVARDTSATGERTADADLLEQAEA